MLYQQARPSDFDEIVGNKSTIKALKVALSKPVESRPHVFLFCGPTGCGKTTLARIVAKKVGCKFDFGLFEINAANTRGIDTIRSIVDQIYTMPMGSPAKVYIFDESHQLTSAAQEGLLKVLEDFPSYCYFIFCTTSPDNIIKTIRNRCSEYQVGPLGEDEIIEVLLRAADILKIKIEDDVIQKISESSGGSPRTSLVLLEKIFGLEDKNEIFDLLEKGTDTQAAIWDICKKLFAAPEMRKKYWKVILELYDSLTEDSETIRRTILTYLYNRVLMCEDAAIATDLAKEMALFSQSTYYGGKSQLGSMIVRACLISE